MAPITRSQLAALAPMEITNYDIIPGKGHPTRPSVVVVPGLFVDAMHSKLNGNMKVVCQEQDLEYVSVKDKAAMGLGPPDVVETMRFRHLINLVKAGVEAASGPAIVVAQSLSVWAAVHAAIELPEKIVGNLYLGPAYDNVLLDQYQAAMMYLKDKADQGVEGAQEKLTKMENCEFVKLDPEGLGYEVPFHMKFVASALPYKLNHHERLPLQPTTIVHGNLDRRVSVASSRALYDKLPPTTSHFVERADLGHNFTSAVAFETVGHELIKLVDTVTTNWAGETYSDGNSQIMFEDLPASHWIVQELADDGTGRADRKFVIKNRITQKVFKNKAAALESISSSTKDE